MKNNTVSEWLLLNAKWPICQLYHDEIKQHFEEMMTALCSDYLFLYSAFSLKQESTGKHVISLVHIIQIPN